jgi:vacuolar-type H+-ATPase subunit C/Vma6
MVEENILGWLLAPSSLEQWIFIVLLGITVLAIIGITAIMLRHTLPVMPYLDANALLSARASFLIQDNKLKELLSKRSPQEFINTLQNTAYFEHVAHAKTVEELHAGIEKTFINTLEEVARIAPKSFKPIVDAYLSIYEAKIIKTFYRARFYGSDTEIKRGMLFSIGEITGTRLAELRKTKTIQDMAVVLADTKYRDVLKQKYGSIYEFESALDSFVFNNFTEQVRKAKVPDKKPITELLNEKFDIMNILLILRFQARKVPAEKRAVLLIKNSSATYEKLVKACMTETPEQLHKELKGTPYWEPFGEALKEFKRDGSYAHFRARLLRYHYSWIRKRELIYSQGAFPILAYLSKKEQEKQNLTLLSKALFMEFPKERIKELVV